MQYKNMSPSFIQTVSGGSTPPLLLSAPESHQNRTTLARGLRASLYYHRSGISPRPEEIDL